MHLTAIIHGCVCVCECVCVCVCVCVCDDCAFQYQEELVYVWEPHAPQSIYPSGEVGHDFMDNVYHM